MDDRFVYWGTTSTLLATGSGEPLDGALYRTSREGVTTRVLDRMQPTRIAAHGGWVCWAAQAFNTFGARGAVACLPPGE